MKLFIENQEIENQIRRVLNQLKLHMNGETAAQMEARGLHYRKNYGVSLTHIKKIAGSISPDYKLAERLWYREERECMLIALLIVPSHELSFEESLKWSQLITNIELIEQASMILYSQLTYTKELVTEFISQNNPLSVALGYYTLGWTLQQNKIPTKLDCDSLIHADFLNPQIDNPAIIYQAMAFLSRKYIRTYLQSCKKIDDLTLYLKASENMTFRRLAEEIENELHYISNR